MRLHGQRRRPRVTRRRIGVLLAVALAVVVVASVLATRGPARTSSGPPGWKLLWRDDFSTLDQDRWTVLDDFRMNGRGDTSIRRNVSISDGHLRLAMTREPVTTVEGTTQYASGAVWSRDKAVLPNYFRVAFRVKAPYQTGLWSGSLWLRPNDLSDGEIDPFEVFPSEGPRAAQSVHSGGYGAGQKTDRRNVVLADPTAWHEVVLEKTEGRIRFSIDGRTTFQVDRRSTAWDEADFETPTKTWFLWINIQTGGGTPLPDATTSFRGDDAALLVDDVTVWTRSS